jgi:predicted small lipoprotein YifL
MRYSLLPLLCSFLFACGKTGALYLPEEPAEPPPQQEQTSNPDAEDSGKTN